MLFEIVIFCPKINCEFTIAFGKIKWGFPKFLIRF